MNLRLAVGPLRPDGYHPIRSLMVTVDGLSDTVEVSRADRREVICPGLDGPGNLAWTAMEALGRAIGRPVDLRVGIEKRIPSQAGLGGGSSDAAATLVGANRALGLGLGDADLERIAADVGSDVPFFIRGGAQWAEGRGERLTPASVPAAGVLIVKPSWGLSTAAVYRAFDRLPAPQAHDDRPPPHDAAGLAAYVRNDLWAPALTLAPRLAALARALRSAGAITVVLCGSGSSLAGFFPSANDARRALLHAGPPLRDNACFAKRLSSVPGIAT